MRQLSPSGQQAVTDLAERHGFSREAVATMLDAVVRGNGGMAQFSHPEFGGSGQWMRGGMTMIGDMFNTGLKARVVTLADELSGLAADAPDLMNGGGDWWPSDLGQPNSSGAQNEARYAYFAPSHRLAIQSHGTVTVYDTRDHAITGFSQQQSHTGSLTLTSQHGTVDLGSLPVVTGAAPAPSPQPTPQPAPHATPSADAVATIERLAQLRSRGILSDDEFAAKKTELLTRI